MSKIYLDVHVPGVIKLPDKMCMDSYIYSEKFFREIFPQHKYKAYTCWSWLLDPEFKLILKPDSNILKFQSRYRLFNASKQGGGIFDNVFPGFEKNDTKNFPRDTSLRRVIAENIENGWIFDGSFGYFLLSDFEKYKAEPF